MSSAIRCDSCFEPTERDALYCYGVYPLRKIDPAWYGNVACLNCQQHWVRRHTVSCVDCGTHYVTINVGVAKRCEPCGQLYESRVSSVTSEKKRTADKDLSSTLNREDWIITLNYFSDRCVYCGGPNHVIDHFTPVAKGGGTDRDNCVPACTNCNSKKRTIDGRTEKDKLANRLNISVERLIEIEQYLSTRTP